MKKCSINGCENKHHCKGYCARHYSSKILIPMRMLEKCSLEDCTNGCCLESGKKRLCSKHFNRLVRKGHTGEGLGVERVANQIFPEATDLDFVYITRLSYSKAVIGYYGNVCADCGWDKARCDVHHVLPVAKGGLNTIRNSVVVCPNCHRLRHVKLRRKSK